VTLTQAVCGTHAPAVLRNCSAATLCTDASNGPIGRQCCWVDHLQTGRDWTLSSPHLSALCTLAAQEMAWLAETSLDESETSLPSLTQLNRGVIRSVTDAFVVALQRCVHNPNPKSDTDPEPDPKFNPFSLP